MSVSMYDTIAALATPASTGGIGIVRISGCEALSVASRVFKSRRADFDINLAKSHTIHYGWIYDGVQAVDEVLLLIMKGPHSYTAENTVEIDCHGGVVVMRRILDTVLRNGARAAEPGEFTKRAFLNGRIDLSQAEAVLDVIESKNEYALQNSLRQLTGALSRKISEIREKILYQTAYIESALDDPEHISLDDYTERFIGLMQPLADELSLMLSHAAQASSVREGIRAVILGKPNAGKSSLMNAMIGRNRAIVTEVAGTTRDVLQEEVSLGDFTLVLADTAGIRETSDAVEQIGVERAREQIEEADLILYVCDASVPLDDNDEMILSSLCGRKVIIILNKSDLPAVVTKKQLERKTGFFVLSVSAKELTGIAELKKTIQKIFYEGLLSFNDEVLVTNLRHQELIRNAKESLVSAIDSAKAGMPEDFYTIDLMSAYELLGLIIGEAVEENLMDAIFKNFCMGK